MNLQAFLEAASDEDAQKKDINSSSEDDDESEEDSDPASCCRPLSRRVNEVRLWHGTGLATLFPILEQGFDEKQAGWGLYGKGIYLASQACKSYQYTETENSGFLGKDFDTFLLYNRVLLGPRPYLIQDEDMERGGAIARDWRGWFFNTGPESVQRRLPRGSDSWIATPGTRRHGHAQAHEEYVVPKGDQIYPEYVVEVVWRNDGLRALPAQMAVGAIKGAVYGAIGTYKAVRWMTGGG